MSVDGRKINRLPPADPPRLDGEGREPQNGQGSGAARLAASASLAARPQLLTNRSFMPDAIYLDNNATTIMTPEVAEAIATSSRQGYANPASSHHAGREARRRLETARDRISERLGARLSGMRADRLVFTSGGTESNNLALLGFAAARPGQIIVSSLEHPSVAAAADRLAAQGRQVVRLPADSVGRTDLASLPRLLEEPTAIVSLMWANNETGVVQPLDEAARICRSAEVPLHSDAVQAVGKLAVDFARSGLTAITVNAHKLHGPRAIGGLLLTHDAQPEPLLLGGFQQLGVRPGTESVELAVGMETALAAAVDARQERAAGMETLRDRFESLVLEARPETMVIGKQAARLPHTSCLAFPGLDRQALLMQLDQRGVACSTGSACASGSSEPSPVLQAMGLPDEIIEGALRFSLSFQTTEDQVEQAAARLVAAIDQLA